LNGPPDPLGGGWTVVIPVKRLDAAKTRLARPDRGDVALAMALDTVRAARGAEPAGVIVVTDDERLGALVGAWARIVPDQARGGLNAALLHGARIARQAAPSCGVAALAGDLPALRPAELRAALDAARAHERAVVGDAAGTGTVLLTALPPSELAPAWGEHSRAAHIRSGATDLTTGLGDAVPGLRRDVDTLADLDDASRLGLGPATELLLANTRAG